MKRHKFALLLTVLAGVGSIQGARPSHAAASEGDFGVSIPRSQLSNTQGAEAISVVTTTLWSEPRYGESARLELSASSWVPARLSVPTHLSDATKFGRVSVPQAALTFHSSPVARVGGFSVQFLGGVGFQMLSRTGSFPAEAGAAPRLLEESIAVVPLRFGMEGKFELHPLWLVYCDLAIMPVAGFTTRTMFDEGRTTLGLPVQAAAGIAHDLRWVTPSFRGVLIKAGAEATASAWTDADFSGVGAQAALSLPL